MTYSDYTVLCMYNIGFKQKIKYLSWEGIKTWTVNAICGNKAAFTQWDSWLLHHLPWNSLTAALGQQTFIIDEPYFVFEQANWWNDLFPIVGYPLNFFRNKWFMQWYYTIVYLLLGFIWLCLNAESQFYVNQLQTEKHYS